MIDISEVFYKTADDPVVAIEDPRPRGPHLYEHVTISLDGAVIEVTFDELKAAAASVYTLQAVMANMVRRCEMLENLAEQLKKLGIEV